MRTPARPAAICARCIAASRIASSPPKVGVAASPQAGLQDICFIPATPGLRKDALPLAARCIGGSAIDWRGFLNSLALSRTTIVAIAGGRRPDWRFLRRFSVKHWRRRDRTRPACARLKCESATPLSRNEPSLPVRVGEAGVTGERLAGSEDRRRLIRRTRIGAGDDMVRRYRAERGVASDLIGARRIRGDDFGTAFGASRR